MLILNNGQVYFCFTFERDLNTLYVDIKLYLIELKLLSMLDLNTLYVDIKQQFNGESENAWIPFKYIIC